MLLYLQGWIQNLSEGVLDFFGTKKSRIRNQKTRRMQIFFWLSCFGLGFLSLKWYWQAILKSQGGCEGPAAPPPVCAPVYLRRKGLAIVNGLSWLIDWLIDWSVRRSIWVRVDWMIPTLILTLTIRYHRYILTLKVLLGLVSILALNLYFSRHHFCYRTQYKNFKDFLFKLRGFQKSKDSTFLKILHTFLTFST